MSKNPTTKGAKMSTVTLNGIDQVNERMYVGGDPMYCRNLAADIDLINENVNVIIDCRSDHEHYNGWNEEAGIGAHVKYLHIPMYDDMQRENSSDDFISAWNQVTEMIEADELPVNPVMFVHCHMGVNRGPSMAMFFLMVEHDMTPEAAFALIRASRFGTGIAYAEIAVLASMDLLGDPGLVDMYTWAEWEEAYWESTTSKDVQDRIKFNRKSWTNQRFTTDDRGIAHVIQGGKS